MTGKARNNGTLIAQGKSGNVRELDKMRLRTWGSGVRISSGAPFSFTNLPICDITRFAKRGFRTGMARSARRNIARHTRRVSRLAPANCHDSLFLSLNALSQRWFYPAGGVARERRDRGPEKGYAMAQKPNASMSSDTGAMASGSADVPEQRDQVASKLVDRFAIWSGVAGLVPLPVVDVLAVGGLQLQLLRRLSQIYDVEFSENRGKALIAALAGCMIPATSGMGAASALKAIPVVNILAAGFVMPVLSAGATYAIGKAFIQHFESGGTLLDFNPPDYREFVKAQKEMWESRTKGRNTSSTSTTATSSP